VRFVVRHNRRVLDRCAAGEEGFQAKLADPRTRVDALEPRAETLVRISALVALGAPETLCRRAIDRAHEAGASDEDVVATLMTVATIVGAARVVAAAPAIAASIGCEIDAALQR
jgi:alkylhydroperoxidase/carboxymuconolactone decarboxylase family protein YurZ